MLMLVIVILFFAQFVICPLVLYLSARILRIKNVTVWRTYLCFFLLIAAGITVFAVSLLKFPGAVILLIALELGLLALYPMIVRWVFCTTFWRAFGCLLLYAGLSVGLAFGIRAVAVEAFAIDSGSMSPTVLPGDKLLADKITGSFRGFRRGEIVAFHPPNAPEKVYIKRIVALAGDRIEVRDGFVYVNGAASGLCPLMPYHAAGMTPLEFPCAVPPGKLFLLGDNRDYSVDSRHFGFVDLRAAVGLAVIVYASVERPLDPHETIILRREGKDPDKASSPNRLRWERVGTVLK